MKAGKDQHMLLTRFMSKEIIKFVLIGALNFVLTYIVYLLLLSWFDYRFSYGVAYFLGIIFSYFTNTFYVFKEKVSIKKAIKFPFVYFVQFFINEALLYLLAEHIDKRIAPLIVIIVTIPITFLLSKYVIKGKSN